MKSLALRFLLCAFVATALSLTGWAQTKAGLIKAVKVQGEVFQVTKDGESVRLTEGALLTETDTVTTGKGASVVLVFMNGATVKLGENTKLAIAEFKMDPLDETIKVAELKKEPSVSKTKLNLTYGEVVGEVKHLNINEGSYFDVQTPVGAAGIRGTTFRIVFRPTGDGKAFTFTLTTAEGVVNFTAPGAAPVPVPQGRELNVTGKIQIDPATGKPQVDPATGKIEISDLNISGLQDASPEQIQVIKDAVVTVISQAAEKTSFTTGEQSAPENGQGSNTTNGNNTPPPDNNTNTTPRVTPQDGSS